MAVSFSKLSGSGTIPASSASRVEWTFGTADLLGNQTALNYGTLTLSLTSSDDLSANTSALTIYLTLNAWLGSKSLGTATPTSSPISVSLDTGILGAQYRAAGWDGIFMVQLEWAGSSDLTLTDGTLTGASEVDIESGLAGEPRGDGLIRRCPKTGLLTKTEHMVKDGYLEGTLVSLRGYDPPDPAKDWKPRVRQRKPINVEG